jgi:myo-inositol-1(or 4)-monophosphatase
MNLELITQIAKQLVIETGHYIKDEQGKFDVKDVEVKGKHDYVTFVDRNSEKKLFEGLSKILPQAGFITEENTSRKKGLKYNWVIDPLDGTTNFIHGLPPYAISVALLENSKIVLGIVYEINSDECFSANIESNSFLNDIEIHVSKTDSIDESLIATGFPYYEYERLPQFMKTLEYFFKNSRGVRRLGSAATDLAYVACSRFDCFYEYNLNPWDVAAGALIVQQAGGKVFDFNGGDKYIFGREIIATNKILSEKYLEVINKIMSDL